MNVIGDVERLIATSLYPLRIPIALALAAAFLLVVRTAYRHRWDRVIRRHPGRTVLVGVPLLAISLPIAWYLGSPLFTKVELNEQAPTAVLVSEGSGATTEPAVSATTKPAASATTGRGAGSSAGAAASAPAATPTDALPAAPAPRSGQFSGADDFHFGRGTATLLALAGGRYVVRFENFSVRNGPDLYVYLSPNAKGYADAALELGRLKATDGNFNMAVPAGSDLSAAMSVVIWCKEFAVQFAVAPLSNG